jgi:hypothetical protein
MVAENLEGVKDALRRARFDIAILDVGLDPDDDVNSDGIKALQMIRETDGGETGCVLVTGWQGDRLDLQASAQKMYGIDWAYMKEKYEAHAVIAKLTELLEQAAGRRLTKTTAMANLGANMPGHRFEAGLLGAISPSGGVTTLYSAVSRLVGSAIPLLARDPDRPMEQGPDGALVGVYWSRALATAVAVGLASADAWPHDENAVPELDSFLPVGVTSELIERIRDRNVLGWLWELPGLDRDEFPG